MARWEGIASPVGICERRVRQNLKTASNKPNLMHITSNLVLIKAANGSGAGYVELVNQNFNCPFNKKKTTFQNILFLQKIITY